MTRRKAPAQIARQVLREMNITTTPVNIESIIKSYDITLSTAPFQDDISGVLFIKDKNDPQIIVNEAHHRNRQRFTMAHELAHFLLHKKSGIHIDKKLFTRNAKSQTGEEPIEIEANRFAAELLMPKELIQKELKDFDGLADDNEDIVYGLAQKLEVSTAAMSIRLQNLGYLPKEF